MDINLAENIIIREFNDDVPGDNDDAVES